MNDEVRRMVRDRLREHGLPQADLARMTGKRPNALSRLLNGRKGGGKVPGSWAAVLAALDLELTAEPRQDGEGEDK